MIQSEGDADTDIVTIALNLTCDGHSVVVAEDTDILMLLFYRWKPDMQDLYMRSEMMSRNKSLSLLNIRNIVQRIDSDILKSLLAIHACWGWRGGGGGLIPRPLYMAMYNTKDYTEITRCRAMLFNFR